MSSATSGACFYCRMNFQASEGEKTIQNFEKVLMLKLRRNCLEFWRENPSDTHTDLLMFFSIWVAGIAMKDVKSQVSSCCSVLIFEIIVFFAFRRKYIQQFLSEALKVLSKSLMFNFHCLYVFGIDPCIFSSFFSTILHAFSFRNKNKCQAVYTVFTRRFVFHMSHSGM